MEEYEEELQPKAVKQVKKEVVREATLVNVPTAYDEAVQLKNGDIIKISELVVKIFNDLQDLKRGLI